MRFLLASCIPLAFLLPACSSGSDGAAAPGGGQSPTSRLVIDTSGSSEEIVTTQLDGVTFERVDGTLTRDVLVTPGPIDLVRPDGGSQPLVLDDPPPGRYAALWLVVGNGSAHLRGPGGARSMALPGNGLRVPFPTALAHDGTAPLQLVLRHHEPFAPPQSGQQWQPDVGVHPDDALPLRLARADVVSVERDAAGGTEVWMRLHAVGELLARAEFSAGATLVREPEFTPLSVEEFLAGLREGCRLLVDGVLEESARLLVTAAVDLGSESGGDPRHGRLRGTIMELRDDEELVVNVLDVSHGTALLPEPRPALLAVDADEARVRWLPRRRWHRGPADFDDLRVGMTVVVHWEGAAVAGMVRADRIDVRGHRANPGREVEGDVVELDAAAQTFVLFDDDAPGNSPDRVEVRVVDETSLLLDNGAVVADFAALRIGQEVRAFGHPIRGHRALEAGIVLIDDD